MTFIEPPEGKHILIKTIWTESIICIIPKLSYNVDNELEEYDAFSQDDKDSGTWIFNIRMNASLFPTFQLFGQTDGS